MQGAGQVPPSPSAGFTRQPFDATTFDELIRGALAAAGGRATRFAGAGHIATGKDLDSALLADAARSRGRPVVTLPDSMQVIGHEPHRVGFFQNMSWSVTALDRIASNDKDLTKRILRRHGLPVAAGGVATTLHEVRELAKGLGSSLVVKPVGGFGGRGVTVDVRSDDDLVSAWDAASDVTRRVLIEECVTSIDVRVMVVGGRAVAATLRVPSHVVGDGVSAVSRLVELKNSVRAANPYLRGSPIELTTDARHRLAEHGMDENSVPASGQRVFLHYKANLGAGGDSYDVSSVVHPSLMRLAESATACFSSSGHAGIDLLVERLDAAAREQRVVVCEVNLNNDIPMHVFPLYGEPVDVARHMIAHYVENAGDTGQNVSGRGAGFAPAATLPSGSPASVPSGLRPSVATADPLRADDEPGSASSAREVDRHHLTDDLMRMGFDAIRFRERLLLLERDGVVSVAERSGTPIFAARLSRRPDVLAELLADAGVPVRVAEAPDTIVKMLLVHGHEVMSLVPDGGTVGYARCPIPGLAGTARRVWRVIGCPPILAVTFAARSDSYAGEPVFAVSAVASDPVLAEFAFPGAGEQVEVYETVARLVANGPRHVLGPVEEVIR